MRERNLKEVCIMNRRKLTKKIKEKWSEFTRIYGHEPGFANVTIRYTDDGNSFGTYISMTVGSNDATDDYVFYYVSGINDLLGLLKPSQTECFYIVDFDCFTDNIL